MARTARALLSTEALLHNIAIIKQHLSPDSQIIAMVKANAYGHGLRSVSLRIQNSVHSLGVAAIDEAIALRKAGVSAPITLMEGIFEPAEFPVVEQLNCALVFHHHHQIDWLQKASLKNPLKIWLKVNTGMGRLGFEPEEVGHLYTLLSRYSCPAKPVGIMSHLACAEQQKHPLNTQQITVFKSLVAQYPGPKSLCNSAAIFTLAAHHYESVRPGLALYGVSPFPDINAQALGLRPVMTLQTSLIAIRTAAQGASIGYGASYICPHSMRIGVIAIGYGDGYPRTAQSGTPVLIKGVLCFLIGRVSMDMATVDLTPVPTAQIGDIVTLWGEGLPLETVASFTHNSPYDLLTSVQHRVQFQWSSPPPSLL